MICFAQLGHTLIEPVPSLFTFTIQDPRIDGLSGLSAAHVKLSLEGTSFSSSGPLLITHVGISGPAVLRLSAVAARYLHDHNYLAAVSVNWAPDLPEQKVRERLLAMKNEFSKRPISHTQGFDPPEKSLEKAACLLLHPRR
jgi:predicted flavoprotein YhiN